jgi:hypothetical protein
LKKSTVEARAKQTATLRKQRRTKDIEESNREPWINSSSLSDAMQHEELGLLNNLKYWANGSSLKAQELVLSLIRQLKMECVVPP